jgi:hypothetical protein
LEPSTQSLEAPVKLTAPPSDGPRRSSWPARHPWVLVCIGLVAISTGLVLWARTSAGFDPYGWLVWGYQTVHLNLNLGGAPSWKPVTYLFTVPYSLFGPSIAYWLWVITAVSVSLGAPIVAGRIVYRIVRQDSDRAWPAAAGAVFAGAGVLGIVQYLHYILSAQSDPMLVTFFLLAIDMHMCGRSRWAFTFLWLCSLGRPEAWPFLGLYTIWAWRAIPSMRIFMVVGLVLIPFFWFGIPVISGSPWDVAGQLAQRSPRELHGDKIIGVLSRFKHLSYWPIVVAAGIGLVLAAIRRNWTVLVIGAISAIWVLTEVAFSLHGFAAVPRYIFEAGAAMIVVAGVGVGWILEASRRLSRPAAYGALALVGVLVAFLVPDAVAAMRAEHKDLSHERARTDEIHRLNAALKTLGGYRFVRTCGDPTTDVEWVSILAWYSRMNVGFVGHRPLWQIRVLKKPMVLFTALPSGWVVHTWYIPAARRAACARLQGAYYVVSPQHPDGTLVYKP